AGEPGWNGLTRPRPRTPWPATSRPKGIAADPFGSAASPDEKCFVRLLVFDDLEDDLAIESRGRRIDQGPDRFRRPALLPDDPPEIFDGHPELDDGRGVALRLLHLDLIGVVHQVFREKLDQFLHLHPSADFAVESEAEVRPRKPAFFMSCATVSVGCAPRRSQASTLPRSILMSAGV